MLAIDTNSVINDDLFFSRAWEEHQIELVAIWAIKQDMLPIECLSQDIPSLVKPAKHI